MVSRRVFGVRKAMMRFRDILDYHHADSSAQAQARADAQFSSVAMSNGLGVWKPGDPIPRSGRRLLIGVATYSLSDLELLDELSRLDSHLAVIDVFNSRDVRSSVSFEDYIPGIGAVYQTPVVGLWENGALVAKATGKSARDLARRYVSLNSPSDTSASAKPIKEATHVVS